eukprot:scaffold6805_cov124-Cylindrotheca_fusiformis.AAC.1
MLFQKSNKKEQQQQYYNMTTKNATMRINPKNATHIPISDGTRSFTVLVREMGLRWAYHQSEYLGHTVTERYR